MPDVGPWRCRYAYRSWGPRPMGQTAPPRPSHARAVPGSGRCRARPVLSGQSCMVGVAPSRLAAAAAGGVWRPPGHCRRAVAVFWLELARIGRLRQGTRCRDGEDINYIKYLRLSARGLFEIALGPLRRPAHPSGQNCPAGRSAKWPILAAAKIVRPPGSSGIQSSPTARRLYDRLNRMHPPRRKPA